MSGVFDITFYLWVEEKVKHHQMKYNIVESVKTFNEDHIGHSFYELASFIFEPCSISE